MSAYDFQKETEAVKMKKGKPTDTQITENVFNIISQRKGKMITPDDIRKEYTRLYERKISWATIRFHLDILLKKDRIEEEVLTKGVRRTIAGYLITE